MAERTGEKVERHWTILVCGCGCVHDFPDAGCPECGSPAYTRHQVMPVSEHQAALQAEREKRREIESKLESGYSFCHPEENDCEGMRAAMAAVGREQVLRSKLEGEIAWYRRRSESRPRQASMRNVVVRLQALLDDEGGET